MMQEPAQHSVKILLQQQVPGKSLASIIIIIIIIIVIVVLTPLSTTLQP